MRHSKLSSLLVAAALIGAPTASAFAEVAPASERISAPVKAKTTAVTVDSDRYAAREAKDTSVAEFSGGASSVVVIGSSTLVIVLLVVLIVLLI